MTACSQEKKDAPAYLASIMEVVDQYDVLIVDMVGVIYNEKEAITGTPELMRALLKSKKPMVLLSNNPRPNAISKAKLEKLDFPKDLTIFTSGDATLYYLAQNYSGAKIFHLGQHKNTDLLHNQPYEVVSHVSDADVIIIGLYTEEDEDNSAFMKTLDEIAASDKPVLCSNPDITAPNGNTTRKTAGYYCRYLEKKGKQVIYMGKPHTFIYDLIWKKFNLGAVSKKRALMIGDTIETDIIGGNQFGLDTLLVLSGNTEKAIPDGSLVQEYLKSLSPISRPTYYMDKFQ